MTTENTHTQEPDDNAIIKEKLVAYMKNLGKRELLIISLYYCENLKYAEIASTMEITVSEVSRIHAKIIGEMRREIGF